MLRQFGCLYYVDNGRRKVIGQIFWRRLIGGEVVEKLKRWYLMDDEEMELGRTALKVAGSSEAAAYKVGSGFVCIKEQRKRG